jgi:hypothetical protein
LATVISRQVIDITHRFTCLEGLQAGLTVALTQRNRTSMGLEVKFE